MLDRSDHDAALIADCGLLPDPGAVPAAQAVQPDLPHPLLVIDKDSAKGRLIHYAIETTKLVRRNH